MVFPTFIGNYFLFGRQGQKLGAHCRRWAQLISIHGSETCEFLCFRLLFSLCKVAVAQSFVLLLFYAVCAKEAMRREWERTVYFGSWRKIFEHLPQMITFTWLFFNKESFYIVFSLLTILQKCLQGKSSFNLQTCFLCGNFWSSPAFLTISFINYAVGDYFVPPKRWTSKFKLAVHSHSHCIQLQRVNSVFCTFYTHASNWVCVISKDAQD